MDRSGDWPADEGERRWRSRNFNPSEARTHLRYPSCNRLQHQKRCVGTMVVQCSMFNVNIRDSLKMFAVQVSCWKPMAAAEARARNASGCDAVV